MKTEISKAAEISEIPVSETENFREIKPHKLSSVKEAWSFIDSLFGPTVGDEVIGKNDAVDSENRGQDDFVVHGNKAMDRFITSVDKESHDVIDIEDDDPEDETENRELTNEEVNDLQKRAIREGFERIAREEKLTDAEKGNLGEMLMDQYYISQGYRPIHKPRVIDLEHKSGQGIDGVYEKIDSAGNKFWVIADAKVNYSQLNKGLADGTDQMSDAWIDKRLDNAVGKEKADEIRDAYEDVPEIISREVYHFGYGTANNEKISSDISTVDPEGNQNSDKELVQVFDASGNYELITRTGGDHDNEG